MIDMLARLALGANFFYFGLNGFFHWTPIPPATEAMSRWMRALEETGYLLTVVKLIEIAAGLCLLTGFFVPLAVAVLAPLVFVIISNQAILNRGRGWGISLLILIPFAILVWTRQENFLPLLGR